MGQPGSSIADRQNGDGAITLHRAIAVVHRRGQRIQTGSLAVAIGLAALGIVATSLDGAAPFIAVFGTAWAVGYAVFLVPYLGRGLRRAAVLQEMFDTTVLGLPWNDILVGEPVSMEEVSLLSRNYRGSEHHLRDYYLVADVPDPYGLLFCLEQNLAWGPRVRRRYTHLLLTILAVWCAAGLVVGLIARLSVADLLAQWYVPSMGLGLLCLDTFRSQINITAEREKALPWVRSAIAAPAGSVDVPTILVMSRRVQDVLFQSRRGQPRVPNWFFRRFHDSDQIDFRLAMRELEKVHSLNPTSRTRTAS